MAPAAEQAPGLILVGPQGGSVFKGKDMEQSYEMTRAVAAGAAWLTLLCLDRCRRLNALIRYVFWNAGLMALIHLSRAFDAPHRLSVRSVIVDWVGLAVVATMIIRAERRRVRNSDEATARPRAAGDAPRGPSRP